MKDLYEILRRKEAELARLQKEVDAIRITVRVLEDEGVPEVPDALEAIIAPPVAVPVANAATPTPSGNGSKQSTGMYSAAWGNSLKEFP